MSLREPVPASDAEKQQGRECLDPDTVIGDPSMTVDFAVLQMRDEE